MTLNLQSTDKFFGRTVLEYIRTVPGELSTDAVGLWQIIPMGRRGFGLSGDDLTEFVRWCVLALLETGAKPVTGGAGTQYDWILQPQYGEATEEIASAVVDEWRVAGAGDPDPGGLWFALPSPQVGNKENKE
jgi:hypothetical protein